VGLNFSNCPLNEQIFIREATTDTSTIVNQKYFAYLKKFWLNGLVRAGVSIRNIEVSVLYSSKGDFTSYQSYSAYLSFLRLQVNYVFGR
jgi:hypothetical protein